METYSFFSCHMWFQLFKSYYVVWKPWSDAPTREAPTWFKSYYVVWKLFFLHLDVFFSGLFKSYYVVWKLQGAGMGLFIASGLNRTM